MLAAKVFAFHSDPGHRQTEVFSMASAPFSEVVCAERITVCDLRTLVSLGEGDIFADLHAVLRGQGTPIGSNDAMIAAHARSLDAVLVTNNQCHFSKVDELKLENWLE